MSAIINRMEGRNGKIVPLLSSLGTILIGGLLLLFLFSSKSSLLFYPLGGRPLEETLRFYLLVSNGFLVFLFGIIIYQIVAARERAGKIADRMIEEVLASREMFYQLYRGAPIPYLLISSDGTIQSPNTAAIRLFGGTSEDIEDNNFIDLLIEKYKDHGHILLGKINAGSSVTNEETQIVTKDGLTRWVLISLYPIPRERRRSNNALVSLFDITEQKEIDRAKTEFVSLASHQLRTPLSAIKWYSELLLSGDVGEMSPQEQKYLQKIYDGNERMIDLVSTLLNVSRLEMGTLVVDMQSIQPVDVIESVLEELAGTISEKNIEVRISYDENINILESDPKLFRMIAQNLISNAVKYTPPQGSVKVTATKAGGELTITVSDTGLGIPLEDQGKIFSKLFRAQNARKLVADGTGLGLYIVKSVVEVLGGTIAFESEPNQGTTFTVILPMR